MKLRRLLFRIPWLLVVVVWCVTFGKTFDNSLSKITGTEPRHFPQSTSPRSADDRASGCAVTHPNGARYTAPPAGGNHGNEALVTSLWPEGKVVFEPDGPGFVLEDGSLSMKWFWWR